MTKPLLTSMTDKQIHTLILYCLKMNAPDIDKAQKDCEELIRKLEEKNE